MKTKIAIMSDLHTDISRYKYDYNLDADVIVVAGDSAEGGDMLPLSEYVKQGKRVIYVAGNHEYYSHEINKTRQKLRDSAARYGINFLDRDGVIINNIRFLGCTLWTDFKLYKEIIDIDVAKVVVGRCMNDYQGAIKCDNHMFTTDDSEELHKGDLAWLISNLNIEFYPTVVVTHHSPSGQSVHPRFRHGNQKYINAGYSSNLEYVMDKYNPNLWIHGHTHDTHDYQVYNTRVICNPRGYACYNENPGWKPIVVEV